MRQRGYIALISVLVISSLLTLTAIGASELGFTIQRNFSRNEDKMQSDELAKSCTEIAAAKLIIDPAYRPPLDGETVNLNNNTCVIKNIILNGNAYTVTTNANYKNIFSEFTTQTSL